MNVRSHSRHLARGAPLMAWPFLRRRSLPHRRHVCTMVVESIRKHRPRFPGLQQRGKHYPILMKFYEPSCIRSSIHRQAQTISPSPPRPRPNNFCLRLFASLRGFKPVIELQFLTLVLMLGWDSELLVQSIHERNHSQNGRNRRW